MAQAANVLVMDKVPSSVWLLDQVDGLRYCVMQNVIWEGDMLKQICPLLTTKQIKRLLELFTPDQYVRRSPSVYRRSLQKASLIVLMSDFRRRLCRQMCLRS